MSINFLEKIIDKLSLNLPFLNRKNSDNNKSVVQNSNVKYVAGRDINEIKLSNPNIKNLSNVEKKVLKLLYEEYNKSGTNGKKIFNVYKIIFLNTCMCNAQPDCLRKMNSLLF
jgi:hypothetical protein